MEREPTEIERLEALESARIDWQRDVLCADGPFALAELSRWMKWRRLGGKNVLGDVRINQGLETETTYP